MVNGTIHVCIMLLQKSSLHKTPQKKSVAALHASHAATCTCGHGTWNETPWYHNARNDNKAGSRNSEYPPSWMQGSTHRASCRTWNGNMHETTAVPGYQDALRREWASSPRPYPDTGPKA